MGIRFAFLLALGLPSGACGGNACRAGAHECSGKVARNCELGGDEYVLRENYCAGRCIDGEDVAFCALSDASLDEPCAGVEEPALRCGANATLLSCSHGYAVNEYRCSASDRCVEEGGSATCEPEPAPAPEPAPCNGCKGQILTRCYGPDDTRTETDCGAPELCIQTEDEAFCAESSEPDPRCAEIEGDGCVDGVKVICSDGHLQFSQDCGSIELCVLRIDGAAFCSSSGDPDPLCVWDSTRFGSSHCEDDEIISCDYGYRISETQCAEGTCVDHPELMVATGDLP